MRDIIKNFFLQNDSLKQSILIEKGQMKERIHRPKDKRAGKGK